MVLLSACGMHIAHADINVSGEMEKWYRVTLTFDGPQTSEDAMPNPFLDYRLTATFTKGGRSIVVPGFYAADGIAAETSATGGNKWRVHFVPDETGIWTWRASFRQGAGIAVDDANDGASVPPDGVTGRFEITESDKKPPDNRARGILRYVGKNHLQFAQNKEYFLKAGADSPENFLGYADFDGTFDTGAYDQGDEGAEQPFIHRYEPHVKDWGQGDPTWKAGQGKGIIGALNYLSSKGVNSVYFLTYNIDGGDGKDVWPWTSPTEKLRFDCSKLDQWEIVFSHMDSRGIMLHVITQEQENDQGLDKGELGLERKLYYRELVARFAHHPALVWNLGEENTNTQQQRLDFARFIRNLDPYDHPIVVHTFPDQYDKVYKPLLGKEDFEGPSLQIGDVNKVHSETLKWVKLSSAQRKWFVCVDEIGPASIGVQPDANDYRHDEVRKNALWANLMAGGAGCEWYFGYTFPNNDRTCENFRSRERMWDLTRYAVEFFQGNLPFSEMTANDKIVSRGWCLARANAVFAVYLPEGGTTEIELPQGRFTVRWFNPRAGEHKNTQPTELAGPGKMSVGEPPEEPDKDWVVVIRRAK